MRGIVYIHVPKCGGSSFGAALRLRYLHSQATIPLLPPPAGSDRSGAAAIRAGMAQREAILARELAHGTRCIAGHVGYSAALHAGPGRDHAFVTLLRDPVDRFVSHYAYLQRRHPDPARAESLAAFLDTPDAVRLASQYLLYFAGETAGTTDDLPAAVTRACRALERFALVGDLSRAGDFARDLGRLAGVPVLPVLHRNRAPAPTRVPEALRPRIEALCAADRTIHASVRVRVQA